jgi:hypothetical protein
MIMHAKWIADAQELDPDLAVALLFETEQISRFLSSIEDHFVSGSKGVGKTLLLSCKRLLLLQHYTDQGTSVAFIPESRPFLDTMSGFDPELLPQDSLALLSKHEDCQFLWRASIMISCLSYTQSVRSDLLVPLQAMAHGDFRALYADMIDRRRRSPTSVFRDVVMLHTVGSFRAFLRDFTSPLTDAFHGIHEPMFLFIDRVDQSVRQVSTAAWVSIQTGLIEAAWECMGNPHVKLYASIREEAYRTLDTATRENYEGSVTSIRYTHDELSNLLDKLSEFYESKRSLHALLGFSQIRNVNAEADEDVFQYLLRHTLGKPRDLVLLCRAFVPVTGIGDRQKHFRDTVNRESSRSVVPFAFADLGQFMTCLGDPDNRRTFLALIHANVLTYDAIVELSLQYNRVPADQWGSHAELELPCHPFCDLYNAGLLGVVDHDHPLSAKVQSFKRANDPQQYRGHTLPQCDRYLIHPALDFLIAEAQAAHRGATFTVYRYVIVGHGLPWPDTWEYAVRVQEGLSFLEPSTKAEVEALLGQLCCQGRDRGAPKKMAECRRELIALQEYLGEEPSLGPVLVSLERLASE